MIITDQELDKSDLPTKGPLPPIPPSEGNDTNGENNQDAPPSYSESTTDDRTTRSASTSQQQTPSEPDVTSELTTTNMINISKINGSVKGAWLIDPAMIIPADFLPPLSSGETEQDRKNALLDTKNGVVDVDLFVLPVSASVIGGQKIRERVSVVLKSWNGEVKMRLHQIASSSDISLPVKIEASSKNGSVHIYIPRSFRGPMQLSTANGSITLSDAVKMQTHVFSDLRGVQRGFLGAFNTSEWRGSENWVGDELSAETKNGSVKVFFDDEATTGWGKPKPPSFFSKLFSGFS